MSVWQRWSSSLGANGVRNGTLEYGCTFAPYYKSYATYDWWKVDLDYVYDVKLVMFLNRGDCCGELYIMVYSVLIHYYTLGIISVRLLMCTIMTGWCLSYVFEMFGWFLYICWCRISLSLYNVLLTLCVYNVFCFRHQLTANAPLRPKFC